MKTNTLSLILISLITCFASLRPAEAVDPSPDGDYPRGNTAEGHNALFSLTNGIRNTALGASALFSNKGGDNNTATGFLALNRNTGGNQNTATGVLALADNEFGNSNTATGMQALEHNTNGSENTANGFNALQGNITGSSNTAIGFGTLTSNTTGRNNTAIGLRAGFSSTTGENNIYIGANMFGFPGESNHTYVRNVNITTVSGAGADTVTVDLGTGLIGHLSSSRRYKENIKSMDNTSEALYKLHPVTFRYKKDIDRSESLAFGLVAEEVAQVNPVLVAHDANGQPESIHYEMVNAMLLNEFLKEHKAFVEEQHKVEKLEATVAQKCKDFEAAVTQLKTQVQKVSAQLEASKPAPQVADSNY